jgi:hypothetical protein
MTTKSLAAATAALLAGASLLAACDKSPQSADGATKSGDAGTAAATSDGTVANTGSPEQNGAGGTPSNRPVAGGQVGSATAGSAPATAAPDNTSGQTAGDSAAPH